jgi:N-acetyl-alpha-D-glucosaminyl L-malate synthase BshA
VAFCIEQSDGVTAVSESLKSDTLRELKIARDIQVIPNFLDCSTYRRRDVAGLRAGLAAEGEKLLIHVSNFRPVKRVTSVVEVFALVRSRVPARLLMVGDGPDLVEASRLARALGVGDAVQFLGEQDQVVPLLSAADVFLLPSAQESFGLAALEAMACEVPVAASRVGGLPEIVDASVGGLFEPADPAALARTVVELLEGGQLSTLGAAARKRVVEQWSNDRLVERHIAIYEEVLARSGRRGDSSG